MIYLASPYSDPSPEVREQRFQAVCRVAAYYMSRGELIFSPIAHAHPIALAGDLPTGFDFWCRCDSEILLACESMRVLMLPGWERSSGIEAEIHIAKKFGKLIEYVDPDTLPFEV